MKTRKGISVGLAILMVLVLGVTTVFATNPHFINANGAVNNAGSLVVNWKEAGLGQNQNIDYVASADSSADYACINGGGNHPSAGNKETVAGPLSASGTFNSGKNGNITASLTLGPLSQGDFACPNGQKLMLARVTYYNIILMDATNNIQADVLGSLCKQFVALDEFACQ